MKWFEMSKSLIVENTMFKTRQFRWKGGIIWGYGPWKKPLDFVLRYTDHVAGYG